MSVQHEPSGAQAARESQQDTKQTNAPAPSITNDRATSYYKQPCKQKPQRWHKLVTWPEGITTWAVLFTLLAIVSQAFETRRSVDVANRGMEIGRTKDRAKLSITVEPVFSVIGETVTADFTIANVGESKAILRLPWPDCRPRSAERAESVPITES